MCGKAFILQQSKVIRNACADVQKNGMFKCHTNHKSQFFRLRVVVPDHPGKPWVDHFIRKSDNYFVGFKSQYKAYELRDKSYRVFKQTIQQIYNIRYEDCFGNRTFYFRVIIDGVIKIHANKIDGLRLYKDYFAIGFCDASRYEPVEELVLLSYKTGEIVVFSLWIEYLMKNWKNCCTAVFLAERGRVEYFHSLIQKYKVSGLLQKNFGEDTVLFKDLEHAKSVIKLYSIESSSSKLEKDSVCDLRGMNVVFLGDVDSGKSTTAARLIYELGGFSEDDFAKTEVEAYAVNKISMKFARMLDKLMLERELGGTIYIKKCLMKSSLYSWTVIDVPGNRKYIKNTITGISQADCAVLVLDAISGRFESGFARGGVVSEHAQVAMVLGVKQIIICVNKMDCTIPKNSRARFEEIKTKVTPFLLRINFRMENIKFVPISGFLGDNLLKRSENFSWYNGPTLVECLDLLNEPQRLVAKPLRLPIRSVYAIGDVGVVAVGRVESGDLRTGLATFGPMGLTGEVVSIEKQFVRVQVANAGDNVGIKIDGLHVRDLKIGSVISDPTRDPAVAACNFKSRIIVLNHKGEIRNGYTAVMDCHLFHVPVKFSDLMAKIHRSSGEVLEQVPKFLKKGDSGIVKMIPTRPVVVERFKDYPALGRFVVRDQRSVVAVGVVLGVEKHVVF